MRLFSTDIDGTIFDGPESARKFTNYWKRSPGDPNSPVLVYNTGRSLEDTLQLIEVAGLQRPDFIIGGVGTQVYDVRRGTECGEWQDTLAGNWDHRTIAEVVPALTGATAQPPECQNAFKSSWILHDADRAALDAVVVELARRGIESQAVYSSKRDLDILPVGANKGNALAWLCGQLGISGSEVIVAGDSGNDATMFQVPGVTGIIVSNSEQALLEATDSCPTYRTHQPCVDGVIEALAHLRKAGAAPSVPVGTPPASSDGLYIVHISIHGLIRGRDLELGRDADTGGQCTYVLELVKALARHPRVGKVDLLTRHVADPKVSSDYARPVEELGHGAAIRRIPAGPRRYLRKEVLWRYLDIFVDQTLALFRKTGRLPDIIHAHYGDAGYVGRQLATLLGCPFIFTGHSLGRTKEQRLLEGGADPERIKSHYNLPTRIEAEEMALDAASLVCTSTRQEVDEQYSDYEFYAPERMRVIPPGVDISRFSQPGDSPVPQATLDKVNRFLRDPDRPLVMAMARADEKKNLATLLKAFGESKTLRNQANLLLVAGNRKRIRDLDPGARKVWAELIQLIDDYDLHGIVAVPKHHDPTDVPAFYRQAAATGGLFVNPALTEPFGLTVIEAAASGVPVLATNNGGPNDILANCRNGLLIDPLDQAALTEALEDALSDPARWKQWSANGLEGVRRHYTWKGHVEHYLDEAGGLLDAISQPHLITQKIRTALPLEDRIVFTGLEDALLDGDAEAIAGLRELMAENVPDLGFGISSGRSLEAAVALVEKHDLPRPDVYITQLGGEIHYGARLVPDEAWTRHLSFAWKPDEIREVLRDVPGLTLQTEAGSQHPCKISYHYDADAAPARARIQRRLREHELPAKVLLTEGRFLDVIPLRSGKGQAIRYVAMRWGLPAGKVLIYARRGSDHEALSGQNLAVLAGDHNPELGRATDLPRVYKSSQPNFKGLLEGIRAYRFDASIRIPRSAGGMEADLPRHDSVLAPDVTALDAEATGAA
jgi:sucrose-phosphate synthase